MLAAIKMKFVKDVLIFYLVNLSLLLGIWYLFGVDIRYALTTTKPFLLPLGVVAIGTIFAFVIPILLYNPKRNLIFFWAQLTCTLLFNLLVIYVCSDYRKAQLEYESRKGKPENIIRTY